MYFGEDATRLRLSSQTFLGIPSHENRCGGLAGDQLLHLVAFFSGLNAESDSHADAGVHGLHRPLHAEMEKGSWVIFDLPGFTTAASGTQQNSLDALRKASETSYFKDKGELWVKVVSPGDPGTGAPGGGASISVSRDAAAVTAAAR